MKPHFSLRAAAAVTVLAAVSLARAQVQTPDAFITAPIDSLAAWDRQMGMLTQMAWNLSASAGNLGPDHAGRTVQSYWSDNVLTREPKRQLDELHAKAVAQTSNGDTEGLKQTITEAEPLIHAQTYKAFIVMGYWGMQENIGYQVKLLQPWLDRASPEERNMVSERVAAAYESLAKNFPAALESKEYAITEAPAAVALLASMDGAVRFFDAERNSLVKRQAGLPSPFTVSPLKREAPCTLSIAPKPGSRHASLAVEEFPSSEQYYPAEMKRRGVTGNVVVRAEVSVMGCAENAQIVSSSGVKELDEAGLKYAMDGHFIPAAAAEGGEAVPEAVTFRVKFELRP